MAAGRNDDPFRGDPLAGDLHGMRIDQHGLRVEYRRAGASQKLAVDAFEASDFAVLGGDQLAPVVRSLCESSSRSPPRHRPNRCIRQLARAVSWARSRR